MSATELRRMRWWDIPSVIAIEESVFPDTAWSSAQFWSELAQDDRAYLVMEQSGRIAAYGGVMVRPPTADIQTIAVDSDHRGRGIARDLLERLLATAEERGCSEVLLEVRADNAAAIALYESEGFAAIARRTSYYGPGLDALIMRRRRA
jgi:[ribosomal protein S18]-alanine N-acetyltransferase